MPYCPNCGNRIEEQNRFCSGCGKELLKTRHTDIEVKSSKEKTRTTLWFILFEIGAILGALPIAPIRRLNIYSNEYFWFYGGVLWGEYDWALPVFVVLSVGSALFYLRRKPVRVQAYSIIIFIGVLLGTALGVQSVS